MIEVAGVPVRGVTVTLWGALQALLRRWPVMLVGAVTTTCLMYLVGNEAVTYWSRTEVVFLAPSSQRYPNSLSTKSEDLIITAGLVAKRLNGPGAPVKYASTDVTLIGTSTANEAVWIRLPDSGGQRAPHFNEQVLIVEVRAPTSDRATQLQEAAVIAIATELDSLQRSNRVDPVNDITVTTAPETAVVYPVTGRRSRAVGLTALLGMLLTLGAVGIAEKRARDQEAAARHLPTLTEVGNRPNRAAFRGSRLISRPRSSTAFTVPQHRRSRPR